MNDFNFEGYKLIVQSRESDLVEYLGRQIPKVYGEDNCVVTSDYIFAKGDIPVILCAHLDTVFKDVPSTILYDKEQGLIWSPEGIGGDDRNGVYSVLYIINKMKDKKPYVIFTTKEETGCQGASKAVKALKSKVKDVNFAIQIDRKGKDDAVFYQCTNKSFIDYICSFGYKEQHGSRTDISVFCPEWDIAGVNFSCGYVNNHTKEEIVSVNNMFNTINMIMNILKDSGINTKYRYKEFYSKKTEKKEDTGKVNDKVTQLILCDDPVENDNTFPEVPSDDDKLLEILFGSN